MLTAFPRSQRVLETDRIGHATARLLIVGALLTPWLAWFLLARLTVYEVSEVARLEVERIHPVGSPVTGRVIANHLVLGRQVRAGEVLVEVEGTRERFELEEERSRLREARLRLRAAEASAMLAADQVSRIARLHQRELVAETEIVRARAESQSRDAEVEALKSTIAAALAAVGRREQEADRRQIRAPVDGRIGWRTFLDIGTVVREGDQLASVVPGGAVRAMAEFVPSALGRLSPGNAARLRLDGFPWTQYGSVTGTVTSVASEARDGRVRVELAVHSDTPSRIPIGHGLTGTAEVEVEKAAPVVLVLRAVGRWLTPSQPPPQTASQQ